MLDEISVPRTEYANLLDGISITETEYINLAENATVIRLALPGPDIESLLVHLDGRWVLVINETEPSGKAVN